jgi:hypothetical protein
MRRILLVAAAVVGAALFAPDAANAHDPLRPRYGGGWSAGYGYSPGFGYGSSYYGYPRPRGHLDYHPGHFHGGRYIPPHIDYHIGRRSYAVDPWTGYVSPFPHRHRHGHGHGHGHGH